MQDLGLESYSLVPLNEHAWDYLQEQGVVTKEVYQVLRKRIEDKDEWAIKTLRSQEGLETMVKLLEDPQKREKMQKVFTHGYSEQNLIIEIIDKLKKFKGETWFQQNWSPRQ